MLAEGWSFWIYEAGDTILRVPKYARSITEFALLDRLMPEVAAAVSTPVPVPMLHVEHGPNGLPFTGYAKIPGTSLITATQFLPSTARAGGAPSVQLSPDFGRMLGSFLRELHAFPVERARQLGLSNRAGAEWGEVAGEFYERVIRSVFPLISCEARVYTERGFERYLNNGANFIFEPKVIHGDLDRQNVLVNAETGQLTGVVDFGDASLGDPAVDLWLPLLDFERLGIADQLPDFLDAYATEIDLDRAREVVTFIEFSWPFHDILHGLANDKPDLVEDGIAALNRQVPRDVKC